MRVFIRFEAFDTITGEETLHIRGEAAKFFPKLLASGKVLDSGIFVGERGGFFILQVDSAEEILELLGNYMVENFHLETHPLISFEKLGELFQKWGAG